MRARICTQNGSRRRLKQFDDEEDEALQLTSRHGSSFVKQPHAKSRHATWRDAWGVAGETLLELSVIDGAIEVPCTLLHMRVYACVYKCASRGA